MPYCSCSLTCQPAPTPSSTRPSLMWSTVAAQFATHRRVAVGVAEHEGAEAHPSVAAARAASAAGALEGRDLDRARSPVPVVAHEVVHHVHAVPPGGLGVAAHLEHVRPRLGQRRPDGEPHAASASTTWSMQRVRAATSSGSIAGNSAMRSWLRPSLR